MIRNIEWKDNKVILLDQSLLPHKINFIKCSTPDDVAEAIKKLQVRGAPLIGVAAAYAMALAVNNYQGEKSHIGSYFEHYYKVLGGTRPTAVNLFWALKRMRAVFIKNSFLEPSELAKLMLQEAHAIYEDDYAINLKIGEYGQELLELDSQVMTICNAGALATSTYGTALGIIRTAHQQGKIKNVWACETRPVLQGARLTVWELTQDEIPVTLITDNMAAYVMRTGQVNAVIVGADRIAKNGDTANKIGTYGLAILANYHNIPFYVAAPSSTLDFGIENGQAIPIEERDENEVRTINGNLITLPEVKVFNPAFDVTPHNLIDAIITEKGIIRAPYSEELINKHGRR